MEKQKTGIAKFMARFTAVKLCPGIEKGSEDEQKVNIHLWYIRAFIIREKIIKYYGDDITIGGLRIIDEAKTLSTSRFIEFLESLEYAIPELVNDAFYQGEVAKCFENRHLYREALLRYQKTIQLWPEYFRIYYDIAEMKRKLGDPTWEDDKKIADDHCE
jgi:hypothetical protein